MSELMFQAKRETMRDGAASSQSETCGQFLVSANKQIEFAGHRRKKFNV